MSQNCFFPKKKLSRLRESPSPSSVSKLFFFKKASRKSCASEAPRKSSSCPTAAGLPRLVSRPAALPLPSAPAAAGPPCSGRSWSPQRPAAARRRTENPPPHAPAVGSLLCWNLSALSWRTLNSVAGCFSTSSGAPYTVSCAAPAARSKWSLQGRFVRRTASAGNFRFSAANLLPRSVVTTKFPSSPVSSRAARLVARPTVSAFLVCRGSTAASRVKTSITTRPYLVFPFLAEVDEIGLQPVVRPLDGRLAQRARPRRLRLPAHVGLQRLRRPWPASRQGRRLAGFHRVQPGLEALARPPQHAGEVQVVEGDRLSAVAPPGGPRQILPLRKAKPSLRSPFMSGACAAWPPRESKSCFVLQTTLLVLPAITRQPGSSGSWSRTAASRGSSSAPAR